LGAPLAPERARARGGVPGGFDDGLERLSLVVGRAASRERCWSERVRAGLVALLGFLQERPCWTRQLFEPVAPGAVAVARERGALAVLTRLLSEGSPHAIGEVAPDPGLLAELVAGGVFAVIRSRVNGGEDAAQRVDTLVGLAPALTAFVLLPYLGHEAAQAQLAQGSRARSPWAARGMVTIDERRLPIRVTRRTLLVLRAIAAAPRSSNRDVATFAGLSDEGQTSRLLARLQARGLIENVGRGQPWGEANAWLLTADGRRLLRRIDRDGLLAGAR
jgi:hypothetical protein